MKRLAILVLWTVLGCAVGTLAWGQQYRVVDYQLRLDIGHLQAHMLSGGATLQVVPTGGSTEPLRLALSGGQVDSVRIDTRWETDYAYANGTLTLPTVGMESPFEVEVRYHTPGYVEDYGWGGFHWSGTIAYNLGVAFGEYPHGFGRAWFPCLDEFDQKATYRMEFTAPTGWTTTASGQRDTAWLNADSSETSRWTLPYPTPTYLISVACGPFRFLRKEVEGIPTIVAYGTQDSTAVAQAFAQLDSVVPMFERCFGPYRWGSIGYTGTPQGSMEHANNISLHNSAMSTLDPLGQNTMAHELSHAWFGNLVTCASSEEMWFNEGGASFCEEVAAEAVQGRGYADEVYQENLYSVLQSTHVTDGGYFPLYGPTHDRTYGSTTYDKGATVWHSLRGLLGEEAFYAAMRRLFADLAFGNVSTHQLCDSLESYTGCDLKEFFRFHVYSPGFVDYCLDAFWMEGNRAHVELSQRFVGCDTCTPLTSTPFPVTFFRKHRPIATCWARGGEGSFELEEEADGAILDYGHALSDAVTEEQVLIAPQASKSTLQMPLALCKMSYNYAPTDTALLHVAHHWCPPSDDREHHNPGILRMASRYWVVDGYIPEGFSGNLSFSFDRSSSAHLDHELLPTTASLDSVRLLYRENSGQPWCALHATRVGTSNQNGSYRTSLRPGQFTLAVVDEAQLAIPPTPSAPLSLSIQPNPAQGTASVVVPRPGLTLTIFDLEGRLVGQQQLGSSATPVALPKGVYLFVVGDEKSGEKCSRKVVFN